MMAAPARKTMVAPGHRGRDPGRAARRICAKGPIAILEGQA